ncbi:SRPBCC family protein [Streptomyces sp. NPDC005813]|uniref:SRPBCC family protein n=1 Tax=Streptomyces sp. NPDC005813 TaxID=3155592 RepID=UPI0033DDB366
MVRVERAVLLGHPLPDVVRWLADFSHAVAWDPGTVSCERVGSGPVAKGAEWLNVSEFRGRRTELRYRLVRHQHDRLTFVGRNRTATSTDDMLFQSRGERTLLVYRARIDFHGWVRLAGPLLKREFERIGNEVSRQLPQALDQHFGSGVRLD